MRVLLDEKNAFLFFKKSANSPKRMIYWFTKGKVDIDLDINFFFIELFIYLHKRLRGRKIYVKINFMKMTSVSINEQFEKNYNRFHTTHIAPSIIPRHRKSIHLLNNRVRAYRIHS